MILNINTTEFINSTTEVFIFLGMPLDLQSKFLRAMLYVVITSDDQYKDIGKEEIDVIADQIMVESTEGTLEKLISIYENMKRKNQSGEKPKVSPADLEAEEAAFKKLQSVFKKAIKPETPAEEPPALPKDEDDGA